VNPDILASYRLAESVTRKRARNFYYSFVVLPPERRRAFCAVYAFMRCCDDISDGEAPIVSKGEGLRMWRAQLEASLKGDYRGNPILPALHDALRRFSIPAQYFHWIIDGVEMDLNIDGYDTFDDLYRYCFCVASAVGLVCLQIFGFKDERAKQYAEYCGIAFQLTNILRDVKEDAAMGRIYLPREDLQKFHYSPEKLKQGTVDDSFRRLMEFETGRAAGYYSEARKLLVLIDETSRPALWAMMEIYGRILKKIVRRQYDVFGSAIHLSSREKVSIVLRAFAMRMIPGGIGLR
jgi:phytoene synthase